MSITSLVPVVKLDGVHAGYGSFEILRGIDLVCAEREVVMIMGHNGAGKSTLAKAALGMTGFASGQISVGGVNIGALPPSRRIAAGMGYVPQIPGIFPSFSVHENLELGGYALQSRHAKREMLERSYARFPLLRELAGRTAGSLSGGQQRLLSVAMAMMTGPKVLFIDEPSAGLAPRLVQDIMNDIRRIRDEEGVSVILIEQNVSAGLSIADRVYVLKDGMVSAEFPASELLERETYWDLL